MKATEMAVIISQEQNEITQFDKWGLEIKLHREKMYSKQANSVTQYDRARKLENKLFLQRSAFILAASLYYHISDDAAHLTEF
jgi:hypothetical protein